EWSADCNGDGIVDFGQIRAGELADANGNNIPDCCEGSYPCGCAGDIVPDGVIDGVDLAAVLNQWGGPGDAEFSADTDGNGVVDGGDLAMVLNGWGACR
ncbi:MAG: Dockerin type domain, partial [Planctomycetota bacterium]